MREKKKRDEKGPENDQVPKTKEINVRKRKQGSLTQKRKKKGDDVFYGTHQEDGHPGIVRGRLVLVLPK